MNRNVLKKYLRNSLDWQILKKSNIICKKTKMLVCTCTECCSGSNFGLKIAACRVQIQLNQNLLISLRAAIAILNYVEMETHFVMVLLNVKLLK